MPKHDYSQYLAEYQAGTPSAEPAKRAGMKPTFSKAVTV